MSKAAAFTVAAAVVVDLAACGRTHSSPPSGRSDATDQWTNVWTAEPGVDLFSRGAELIRATFESGALVHTHGTQFAYIGYGDAVGGLNPDLADNSVQLSSHIDPNLRGGAVPDTEKGTAATEYNHLTAYTMAGSTVSATICSYRIYPDWHFTPDDLHIYTIALTTNGDRGSAGQADRDTNDRDSAHRVPTWNVFGTWKITEFHNRDIGLSNCTPWWQARFPGFALPDSATSPVIPNPPTAHPVAPQYPGWVAPANA